MSGATPAAASWEVGLQLSAEKRRDEDRESRDLGETEHRQAQRLAARNISRHVSYPQQNVEDRERIATRLGPARRPSARRSLPKRTTERSRGR